MGIEIKRKRSEEMIEEVIRKRRKVFVFKWNKILPRKSVLISDKIFFYLDFNIKYKKPGNDNKIILFGEFNDKFWFFKFINDSHEGTIKFAVDKPLMDKIHKLSIYIIDWYKIAKKINFKKMEIEYGVSRER